MRKVLHYAFLPVSVGVCLLYFLASLTPYISQVHFWPLSFLSLGFPLLALCMLGIIATWFLLHKRTAFIVLIVFLSGYKNLGSVVVFRLPSTFNYAKDSSTLRVLDWNIHQFSNILRQNERPYSVRRKMINYLREANADVLMMQEFVEAQNPMAYSSVEVLRDSLGYKYFYISIDQRTKTRSSRVYYGCAIFSKYPLINKHRVEFNVEKPEGIAFADVLFRSKNIRLATMHLASLDLGAPSDNREFFGRVDKEFLMNSSRMEKLRYFDSIHARQADLVRKHLNESPYPVVISGDFNSVPSSYTYHKVKGDLQDCFLLKGSGFGRTYTGLFPTLRIDYILANKQLKVLQYDSPRLYLSDHFPVVADLAWR